jgi:hypothetical protein
MKAGPFAEIGRVAPKIDGDVPDVTGEDTDELALGLIELVMQAPKNPFRGERLIILNEMAGKAGRRKDGLVENLSKPTATIAKAFGLKEFDIT